MKPQARVLAFGGILVAAIAYYVWSSSGGNRDDRPPDTPESKTHWMCDKCGREVDLTAKQMDDWMKNDQRIRLDPQKSSRQVVFKCDACAQFAVCRATYCRIHAKWFVADRSDGSFQDCPACMSGKKSGG